MRLAWIGIVVLGCRAAPAPSTHTPREAQLERDLATTRARLATAEVTIDAQRAAMRARPPARVALEAAPAAGDGLPAECHEYKVLIEQMLVCDPLKGAASKMRDSMDSMWAQLLQMPDEQKAAMKEGCKAGAEAMQSALTTAGC